MNQASKIEFFHLLKATLLSIFQLVSIYYCFGSFFEESEVISFFITKSGIVDINIPVNYNAHIFTIIKVVELQEFFPNTSVFGTYCYLLLLISLIVINYYIIYKKNTSNNAKIFIFFITSIFLLDNIVQIHNSRIAILLFTAYTLIIYHSKSFLSYITSVFILILACITRVEYGFIFFFILILNHIFNKEHRFKLIHLLTTLFVSTFFIICLYQSISNSDPYAKQIFLLEREYDEKNNYQVSVEEDLEKEKTFLQALKYYVEDRDIIQPEEYIHQLKYKSPLDYIFDFDWIDQYIKNALFTFNEISNSFIYIFYILATVVVLIRRWDIRTLIFIITLIAIPFAIIFQAELGSRFYATYIASFFIIYIIVNDRIAQNKNWLVLIIFTFGSFISIIKSENKIAEKYNISNTKYDIFSQKLQHYIEQKHKIIHSNFMYNFYMNSNIFYNQPVPQQMFLGISFWHYYDSFRTKRGQYFKDQTCIQSMIMDICNNPKALLISTDEYVDFLIKYLELHHNTTLKIINQEHIIEDVYSYTFKVS